MAVLSTTALVAGLALAGAGVGTSVAGAVQANNANKEEIAANQKAEATREQAQKLDAMRKQREMVRQGTLARSQALTTGANQGAQFGSGVAGALAGIGEQTAYNTLGVSEASQTSSQLFEYNRQAFAAKRNEADAATVGAVGSGLSTLGGALLHNIGNIDKIGGAAKGFTNG